MKNKTNEANNYGCVLCEDNVGDNHGALCSENENNLTEEEKRLLRIIVENEIESFGNKNNMLSIEYQNILQKL